MASSRLNSLKSTRKLTNFLTTPSRVASKLDWNKRNGAVLALDIGKDRIGMALASHPLYSSSETHMASLSPIELSYTQKTYAEPQNHTKRILSSATLQELESVMQTHNVCALLVGWPLSEGNRIGAPCGKVLHTLDCLVEESSMLDKRPVCLWTGGEPDVTSKDHASGSFEEDDWGRAPIWAHPPPSTKTVHIASQEQYTHHEASDQVALRIWNDFSQNQWPDLYQEQRLPGQEEQGDGAAEESTSTITTSSSKKQYDEKWLEQHETSGSFQTQLL
mmetsp:Transcript_24513/g.27509  ORF Transcript_24513/g.27509 Transcript_24513/m.27509 type:complete len:276 (+) Transcript_24513:205-1032(+)